MAYGTKYILGFTNELNQTYEVYLEYKDFVGASQNIISAVDGLVIRSVTGDENKLTPILGSECLLNIVVGKTNTNGIVTDDSTLTIYDLISQHDNDIRVTIYRNREYTKIIWQGFVVVEDNSQPFLDPPFTLSVRALDGLGLLKNVDMTDTNGDLFTGVISVEDWLGNILYKTGQTLPLRVYFPFLPVGASETTPPLQQVFLNAITWQIGELTTTTDPSVNVFESEANDANTALEYLCRNFRARIFQEGGAWNFISLYSYVDPNGFSYNESTGTLTDGVYHMTTTATGTGLNYDVPIGHDQILHPVQNDAILYLKLATKWIKLNYNYDQSPNKICNQNFKIGNAQPSLDGTIPSSIEDTGVQPPVTFSFKAYEDFCWTNKSGTNHTVDGITGTAPYPENPPTVDIYTRSVLDITGAEENRYLVIPEAAVINHARSSTFLLDVNDGIEISFDFRTYADMSPIRLGPLNLFLDGDDGSKWGLSFITFGIDEWKWWPVDADYNFLTQSFPPTIGHDYAAGEKTNQWTNISVSRGLNGGVIAAPVSGTCFVLLEGGLTGAQEFWFKNLRITIKPYLQGSYVQLNGDYNFSSSLNDIKQTYSEDVQLSDSPKRYFKGALLQSNGDLWPAAWHRKGVTESFRFTQLMERIVYNNLKTICQKIEGDIRGLTWTTTDFEVKQVGYANRYYFTDHPVPTKKFILTSFEKDYGKGSGRHVFVEILEDENDFGFDDPADPAEGTYKFQYLFQ